MKIRELFEHCLVGPWFTEGEDVQYFIQRRGSEVVLSFQCSRSKSDWAHNFDWAVSNVDLYTEPYRRMATPWKAHRGFVRLWKSVRDNVIRRIEQEYQVGISILSVTGFSQGAAIATLAHEDMKYQFPRLTVESFVFGGPRVLWNPPMEIRERFIALERWYVQGDIVPHLAPVLTGYCHVGRPRPIGPRVFPWYTHHEPKEYRHYLPE